MARSARTHQGRPSRTATWAWARRAAPSLPATTCRWSTTRSRNTSQPACRRRRSAAQRSDLIVVRVTDESGADAGKKRYALSLSIHGIERAGVEGGTRAMEDLVTARRRRGAPTPRCVRAGGPSFDDVLKKTIIYFTYPNPDGWRARLGEPGRASSSSATTATASTSTATGPTSASPSGPTAACPSPRAARLSAFFGEVEGERRRVLRRRRPPRPAVRRRALLHAAAARPPQLRKDQRIRAAAKAIHNASEQALQWSPIIQPNDAPRGRRHAVPPDGPSAPPARRSTRRPGARSTTRSTTRRRARSATGSTRPSASARTGSTTRCRSRTSTRTSCSSRRREQLHVAGNKSMIYAHLASILRPPAERFSVAGSKGYVPNLRLTRDAKDYTPAPPAGTVAQSDIVGQTSTRRPTTGRSCSRSRSRAARPADGGPDAGKDVFNGGMRRRRDDAERAGHRRGRREPQAPVQAAATSIRASTTATSG